ncbi:hypothetical protein KUTeg_016250, partial [Tegillarca granosa]
YINQVAKDEETDEFASYFNRDTTPKVLITTSDRPCSRTNKFCKELKRCIPNSEIHYRRGLDLKKIIPQAMSKDFTDIMVINEDRKEPNGLVISHLPNGPTAHFKVSNVRLSTDIKRVGEMTGHKPEIILNNFNTRLGHSVGRMFASLFPHDPQYVFRNSKRVGLKELGPRFTMKLRSLQKGTFDSKFGEFEWVHKKY